MAERDPGLRDRRAREHLANERTLLAWTRTALTLIGLGFVVARFGLFLRELGGNGGSQAWSTALGIAVIGAGLLAGAAGGWRYLQARKQIEAGEFRAELWAELLLVGITAALGVALAVYLAVNG